MATEIRLGSPHEAWQVYSQTPEFDSAYIDERRFVERLARDDALVLVATRDGADVAFKAGYDRYSDGIFYSWLGSVLPAARGSRLAALLIDAQEERVRALGFDRIYVKTRNRFVGMRVTLARCGYDIVGFDAASNAVLGEAELLHCKRL